jgi:hypothetical protein
MESVKQKAHCKLSCQIVTISVVWSDSDTSQNWLKIWYARVTEVQNQYGSRLISHWSDLLCAGVGNFRGLPKIWLQLLKYVIKNKVHNVRRNWFEFPQISDMQFMHLQSGAKSWKEPAASRFKYIISCLQPYYWQNVARIMQEQKHKVIFPVGLGPLFS